MIFKCPRNLVLASALLFPLTSFAEEPPEDLPPKPGFLDFQRDYVSDKFVGFANTIDSFFGDDRSFQETNNSVLQVDATRVIQQNNIPTIGLTYKAKLHLPNAQKRLHLILESNPDQTQNLPGATLGQQLQQQQSSIPSVFKEVSTPNSYGAALRFQNKEGSPFQLSADGGLKADNGQEFYTYSIHPFARSSASYVLPLGAVQMKLTESLFWFNTTGAGESSLLDLDQHLTDKVLFRSSSGATFFNDNQDFSLHQDFSIFRTVNQQASLLYQVSANGISRPSAEISEYVALVLYRRRIHRDWVFLEVNPQLHYPKANNFQLNAQFIVRLQFMFSK
jgi:hypothetical protein